MLLNVRNKKKKIYFISALIFAVLLIYFSKNVSVAIIYGIRMSVTRVIPIVFPFLILSDFILAYNIFSDGIISRILSRIFGFSRNGATAFITGFICGFPNGVKCASDLYQNGMIDKDECEILIGVSNNPSLAFILSGVGLGIRANIFDGLLLLFMTFLSALILSRAMFLKKPCNSLNNGVNIRQSFDLVDSVKKAGISSLYISSNIIFFSLISSLFSSVLKSDILKILIDSLLEISNGCIMINSINVLSEKTSLVLTAFAIGFSGFSVHLQSFCFLPKEISRKKYLYIKFLQGVIMMILSTIYFVI